MKVWPNLFGQFAKDQNGRFIDAVVDGVDVLPLMWSMVSVVHLARYSSERTTRKCFLKSNLTPSATSRGASLDKVVKIIEHIGERHLHLIR